MVMKKSIYTVNGSIVGEKTTGGSRIDYLTDMLGSVTATVNQSAQVRNTYRYKPYGGTLAKTGTDPDPTFGWVGTQGYRPTQKKFSDFYVRARHADSATGRWSTLDPIFRTRMHFDYALANPGTRRDATGLLSSGTNGKCIRLVPVPFYPPLCTGPPPALVPVIIPDECCYGNYKPMTCRQLCAAYLIYPKEGVAGGAGVVCCGGLKCACIFGGYDLPYYPGEGVCPEIDLVICDHEEKHFPEVDCAFSSGLHRHSFPQQGKGTAFECEHRKESLSRLRDLTATGDCLKFLTSEIAILENWILKNCH